MRRYLCLLLLLGVPLCAQNPGTVEAQPPLRGVVTIVEPEGQFYLNIGSKDQLFSGATLEVYHDGNLIARASTRKIEKVYTIAQLLPAYHGVRVETGDLVQVSANPVPQHFRQALPEIEVNTEMRDRELFLGTLLLVGIGIAILNN